MSEPNAFEIFPIGRSWFWEDADCDEPMGPFETGLQAVADYELVRGLTAVKEQP